MIAFTMKRYNSSGSLADSAFCTDLFTFLKPAQIPVYIIQNKKMGAETSGVSLSKTNLSPRRTA
jgi:hypothetical protein